MTERPDIQRLTRRPQFLAAARARSEARGAVVVQCLPRDDGSPHVGVGFTATRKIGGAVVRNRAKRRLREAARALLPRLAEPGCDYVLVARMGTPARPWDRLLDDVASALTRLATQGAPPRTPRAPAPGQDS
ncbi:MAG: ribonuclease P protein component [Brevundimonas sp.]|jgi:ribonuclease P protein component|uniref:ribonuclease P protein component n=1 Tax=Brevundimonas sp. TaxID=1871086 RepID=UPI0022CBF8DE|nr:ribonuclease P protein component [Brevundimonas sp.]MCZ8087965.1 ribonuclease P protein component [Brevundimonas sp.]MCZ8194731.1 ribonuclease P protein component [Brevundimonas sp.]